MFTEIQPGEKLRPYIKGLYFYESATAEDFDDIVFPSGNMEVIFNLGEGHWKTQAGNAFYSTPPIELWGQVTKPLAIQSSGKNIMLGARFYPHTAACFFDSEISSLNNEIADAPHIFGASIKTLHARLLDAANLTGRIALLEEYLYSRLAVTEKKHRKIKFIADIASSLKDSYSNEKIMSVSSRNNISARHLNQLFSQYTGLPPKLFFKINRFQNSLTLINSNHQTLTGVAYDAGYFDQSHFIKEFKLFTGITPTLFSANAFPINKILANN